MDSMDLDVLRQVQQWCKGEDPAARVVLGTITRTWGSAPRPVSSVVAIRLGADGSTRVAGSVSGGCIEDDLVAQIRAGALGLAAPAVTRYGVGAEAARQIGLPCGGLLEIVLEPVGAASRIDELLVVLARGERIGRTPDLASGPRTPPEIAAASLAERIAVRYAPPPLPATPSAP